MSVAVAIGCAASDDDSPVVPAPMASSSSSGLGGTGSTSSSSGRSDTPAQTCQLGCVGGEGSLPTARPIWLQPGDLATATRGKPIRAYVPQGYPPLSDAGVENITGGLELRDALDGGVVPTTPSITGDTSGGTWIELVPNAPLPDAWYVLSASVIPRGFALATKTVRFYTGSRPLLTRMRFCEKANDIHVAMLELSEPVQAPSFDAVVSVDLDGVACASLPNAQPTRQYTQNTCADTPSAKSLHFKVNEGITSATNVPLRTLEGATTFEQTFDLTTLPLVETGCRGWSATLEGALP